MGNNPKGELLAALVQQLGESPNVVEIGCTRVMEEAPTDGWSSVYLSHHAGVLVSVDISNEALLVAYQLNKEHGEATHLLYCSDGTEWLASQCPPLIDLLYLDSSDDPLDTLTQVKVALPHLAPKGIIAIDDVQPMGANWFGKGLMAIPFLLQQGWTCEIRPTLRQADGAWWAMAVCRRLDENPLVV